MSGVTLERVSCAFRHRRGEVHAVRDLDLAVAGGELLTLVGPSGCGKTTTLRLIAGLLAPSTGLIRIGDRVVNHTAPKDRDVAMVFQSYALYPHMDVYKNLAFGLRMRRMPRADIRPRVEQTAAKLGISHLLTRRPATLSGGERQRVALGRAIARTPRVFLLDEPLSNLDPRLRLQMRAELKALHLELGTTFIHVTHDQEEAMTLGNRIAVMNRGELQQVGFPREVYERPVNRFVAAFIGAPPMNLFRGELQRNGDDVWFAGRVGRIPLTMSPATPPQLVAGPAVLGIRPQHVRLTGDPRFDNSLALGKATVRLVELLGDCVDIHLVTVTGETIVVRTSTWANYRPGQITSVSIDAARVHLFDADASGQRLN